VSGSANVLSGQYGTHIKVELSAKYPNEQLAGATQVRV